MKIAIILAILVLMIAGCGEKQEADNQEIQQEGDEEDVTALDLATLLGTGKEAKCTAEVDGSSSTLLIKGGKERIESSTPDGNAVLLILGNVMYMWDADTKQGVKIDLDAMDEVSDSTTTEVTTVDEINNNAVNVECKEEKISDDVFKVPADVNFMDMAEMMAPI